MRREPALDGALLDQFTQRWVIATGRPVEFAGAERWLDGPIGAPGGVGEDWIDQHAAAAGASLQQGDPQGLLPDFSTLAGPGFEVDALAPAIVDFYEHTSAWSVDVWSRWSRWAEPGGRLINALFARRLRQLSLPVDPLEVAYGIHRRVIALVGPDGSHLGTAWQRTMRATGTTTFGGFYGVATRPSASRPSIRVVFPLPNGSLTVFLRPDATADGGLVLSSPAGGFGDDGAYLIVRPGGRSQGWVRRIPPARALRAVHRRRWGAALRPPPPSRQTGGVASARPAAAGTGSLTSMVAQTDRYERPPEHVTVALDAGP